jgi:cytochrome c-type biogenesis protein CcmH/NrfG
MSDTSDVVAPPNPASAPSHPIRVALIILGCIIVIAAGTYVYLHDSATTADNQTFKVDAAETQNLSSQEKFAQVARLWINYANQTPSKSHRAAAWQFAGAAYINNSQFSLSLAAYKRAIAITGLNYDEANGAATAAARLGNAQEAVYYFKQASRLIPASMPYPADQRALFNEEIQEVNQMKR